MTPLPVVLALAAIGLIVGSFLNVVVHRVPREQSILFPNSYCPHCRTPLKLRHSVPVLSWVLLRGRCAFCRATIGWRYPTVEAGTALLFAAIGVRFGVSVQLPAYLYLAAVGITLALIDADGRSVGRGLPDSIVLPSYVVTVLLLMPAGAVDADWTHAGRALASMGALWAVYFVLALAYPGGMGFGDVKLAGLIGLYLGWLSWGAVVIGVFGAFVIGGFGGYVFAATRPGAVVRMPIGSSLITGGVLALFVAVPITQWYGSMLGVA